MAKNNTAKEEKIKTCPWCGKEFKTSSWNKRYCSWRCRNAYYYRLGQMQKPYYHTVEEYEKATGRKLNINK